MFEKIIEKIEKYESIVIFGHINPDGDCFGSQVALKHILKEHYPNKNVLIYGNGLPVFESLLGETDYVPESCVEVSLAVVLDCNDLTRVDDEIVYSALDFVKIDHHIDLHSFKEGPEVIDTNSTSTAELIYRLAKENNFEISSLAAKALYLGLFTDTGRFQYASDYAKMFEMAKDLVELGAEPLRVLTLLNRSSLSALELKTYVYTHYQRDPDGLLYLIVSKKDRQKLGVSSARMVGNTNLISHVYNYPIWFIVSETDNGGMQVEIRSEGETGIDVQKVAASFGGGGHTYAAGFTIKEFNQENINKLISALKQALKERKN